MVDKILAPVELPGAAMLGCQKPLTVSRMYPWVARMAERSVARAGAAMPGCHMPLTVSPICPSAAQLAERPAAQAAAAMLECQMPLMCLLVARAAQEGRVVRRLAVHPLVDQ